MYDLPIDIVLDLFDKMILPILLYGSEIWGYENLDSIEVFYRAFLRYILRLNKQTTNCMVYGEAGRKPLSIAIKFLKYILRLNKQTASCMVYGEAGRKPLSITIKSRMICFWHQTTTGPNNKLSYKLTGLLKNLY